MASDTSTSAASITQMLQAWSAGDKQDLDLLLASVYDEIHTIAEWLFSRQPVDHTWQATALCNEFYLILTDGIDMQFANRQQFFAFVAKKMRYLLINKAERRNAVKRFGNQVKLGMTHLNNLDLDLGLDIKTDLLDLEKALQLLEIDDKNSAAVFELRFFCGLSIFEVVETLGLKERTANRRWAWAKAFLTRELARGISPS